MNCFGIFTQQKSNYMKDLTGRIPLYFIIGCLCILSSCGNEKSGADDNDIIDVEPTGAEELFSVVTLNVDGLPKSINIMGLYDFSVNEDGPGAEYTPRISRYLADMNYDFISVQENFNYDPQLYSSLSANYDRDIWPGELDLGKKTTDFRFITDGLNAFWKKDITANRADSVSWTASYGKFNHAWDAIITKGFRRYDLILSEGSKVVIYNMHMDAGDDEDEAKGLDGPDRRARMSQWRQLRDYILRHLDKRPVIIMGDLNSWYERDSIKIQFIDEIEKTGRATVSDVWIELVKNGSYPEIFDGIVTHDPGSVDWSRNGELLDKILYINPKGGARLYPMNIFIDHEGYQKDDGTPLGDHSPLSVTFKIRNQAL